MMRKTLSVFLAVMTLLLPLQGQLYAVTFTATGTVSVVSSFTATLKKVSDNSAITTNTLTFPTGSVYAKADGYVDVTFTDNTVGFQAILISTTNRTAAVPNKYTGIAQGSGMVGVTDTSVIVPLLWMVSDALITGGYTFVGAPGEYFVSDKQQGTTSATQNVTTGASACNDLNKNGTCETGEFTEYNGTAGFQAILWTTGAATSRCPSNTGTARFEGTDWDGDCYDGAKPFDNGFASVVYGISGGAASLSGAAGASIDNTRTTTDGNVKVYLGTNYTGADAQAYKTVALTFELATVA